MDVHKNVAFSNGEIVTFWSKSLIVSLTVWTASSGFGTYRMCEQRRFRRACASAQSRQKFRCSLIQAVSQEEPSDRKPDPWLLSMAGHAQLKFVMTECSKTQIRLTGLSVIRETKSCIHALVWLNLLNSLWKTTTCFITEPRQANLCVVVRVFAVRMKKA